MKHNRKWIAIAVLCLLITVCCCACDFSYGKAYDSLDALKVGLQEQEITLLYPQFEAEEGKEQDFVLVRDPESKAYVGYKIYDFDTPFYCSVSAFNYTIDGVISDDINRLTKEEQQLSSKYGSMTLYTGKGHEDALFLIGVLVIDGCQYEIRVTNDNVTEKNKFVHAIYKDNEYYPQAIDTLVRIADGLNG